MLDFRVFEVAGDRDPVIGNPAQLVARQIAAAGIGERILAALPGVRVDLQRPDLTLALEIRDEACIIGAGVWPGVDARPAESEAQAARDEGAEPRFLVDAMLGTLASRLRALGYDTAWRRDTADSLILREAHDEGRIVLTQDRELAGIGGASAHLVESKTAELQLAEVLRRFGLTPHEERLFTRCSVCNTPLERVDKALVVDRLPPLVAAPPPPPLDVEPARLLHDDGGRRRSRRADGALGDTDADVFQGEGAVAFDVGSVLVGWGLALTLPLLPEINTNDGRVVGLTGLAVLIQLIAIAGQRLHQARVAARRAAELSGIARSALFAGLFLAAFADIYGVAFPIARIIAGGLLTVALLSTCRAIFSSWLRTQRALGKYARNLLLVGTNAEAVSLKQLLDTHPELGYHVAGITGDEEGEGSE